MGEIQPLVSVHVWLLMRVPEYFYTVVLQFFWVFLPSSSETVTEHYDESRCLWTNFMFYSQRRCTVSVVSLLISAQFLTFYFLSFKFRPNFQRLHHFLFAVFACSSCVALQSRALSFLFVCWHKVQFSVSYTAHCFSSLTVCCVTSTRLKSKFGSLKLHIKFSVFVQTASVTLRGFKRLCRLRSSV